MTLIIYVVKHLFRYAFAVSKERTREAIVGEVIQLLRAERERQRLSMNVLAQQSGLSQSTISLMERDLRNPTLDSLLRIADVLGVDLGEIISKARQKVLKP